MGMQNDLSSLKYGVKNFWEARCCGAIYAQGEDLRAQLNSQSRKRYELEPYIKELAHFQDGTDKSVLEICP